MLKKISLLLSFFLFFLEVFPQSKGVQLLQEGIQLYQQNRGKECIEKLSEAGSELKKNNEWANYATCQCGLANILSGYGQYDKANNILNETFPVIEKNLPPNDPKLGLCYLNKAMVELNQRNYKSAQKFLHKGLGIRKASFPPNSNECLEVISLLSKIHIDLANPDSALYYSSIFEKELINRKQEESALMADVYNTKGNAFDLKKDYANAILYHTKSLEIREKNSGANSSEVAYSLGNLSLAYQSKGDYLNAESTGLKSYEIRKKLFGLEDEQTQLSIFNLASLYSEMGEWKKAMQFYDLQKIYLQKLNNKAELAAYQLNYGSAQVLSEQNISEGIKNIKDAAAWYSSSSEQSKNNLATCYQNLTLAYTNYGDYEQALEYNSQSAAIKKQLGIIDPESQLNAGNIFYYKGNTVKALNSYNQALVLYEKKYGYGHHKHITAIENIALASSKISASASKQVYEVLLNIYKDDEGKQADVLVKLGNFYLVYTQFDSAVIFYNKAKIVYKKTNNVAGLVNARSLEGVVAMGQKKYGDAEKIFSEVLTLNEKEKNSYFNCKTLNNLALVQCEQQLYDKAAQTAEKAILCNKNTNGEIKFMDEYLRSRKLLFKASANSALIKNDPSALKSSLEVFSSIKAKGNEGDSNDEMMVKAGAVNSEYKLNVLAVKVCSRLYKITHDRNYVFKAAEITEDCKSVMIKKALRDINCKKLSGVPQDLIIAERKTVEECEQLALSLNSENLSEEDVKRFTTKLADLYRQQDSIKNLIKNKYPKYNQLVNSQNFGTEAIQQKLGDSEAVLNFVCSPEFFGAVVISNKQVHLLEFKNNPGLEKFIADYREGIDKNDYSLVSPSAHSLYKSVFEKADSLLEVLKIKKITIVPEGPLFFFPFESLVKTAPKAGDNFSTLNYLVKSYEINYQYAASLLLTQGESRSTATKDYIAIAPVFSDKNEVAKTRGIVLKPDLFGKKKRSFLSDGTYINPLPGTLAEIDIVSNNLNAKGKKCTLLKFDMANEKAVKESSLKDYKLIHFATHGFVNEDMPNYSGLILAQNGETEDNILFASEIYNLSLNADLVVLSACQTGLGKVSEGEGLIGLSRGFMYAGAKNLIVSLWPVSDEGTSKLMVDFFGNVDKGTYSNSLRNSKLKLISDPALASPFYWAPFILIGK